MAFKDWRTKTKCFDYLPVGYHAMAERIAQAAYKAGERNGVKLAEEIASNAFLLADILKGKK